MSGCAQLALSLLTSLSLIHSSLLVIHLVENVCMQGIVFCAAPMPWIVETLFVHSLAVSLWIGRGSSCDVVQVDAFHYQKSKIPG